MFTNKRLARWGYVDISEAYKSLYFLGLNRRVRTRMHGGVRGRPAKQGSASCSMVYYQPIPSKLNRPDSAHGREVRSI